jgi:hypothetical protein
MDKCDDTISGLKKEIGLIEGWKKGTDMTGRGAKSGEEEEVEIREMFDEKYEEEWREKHRCEKSPFQSPCSFYFVMIFLEKGFGKREERIRQSFSLQKTSMISGVDWTSSRLKKNWTNISNAMRTRTKATTKRASRRIDLTGANRPVCLMTKTRKRRKGSLKCQKEESRLRQQRTFLKMRVKLRSKI